jgi:hypothetical protein
LLIPSVFLEGFDALFLFVALAFGLRASLFERACPLVIVFVSQAPPRLAIKIFGRAFIEADLDPVQQGCPGIPSVSASLEALAYLGVRRCQCPKPIRLFERAASARRVFGSAPCRAHLAFRFEAANASRALEYRYPPHRKMSAGTRSKPYRSSSACDAWSRSLPFIAETP